MKKYITVLATGVVGMLSMASPASASLHPIVQQPIAQVSAVPEPATWAMLIVGVAFIGFAMRRRTRSAAV